MGLAYLSDGSRIDYKVYIEKHPHWQKVRKARFIFDNGSCIICHRDLRGEAYQTHHMTYQRLGHERMRDVVTMCASCHDAFHKNWNRVHFWRSKEKGHWDVYDLPATARLCSMYWQDDRLINKDPSAPNLCAKDVTQHYIDKYYAEVMPPNNPIIDPYDISLFVRNKRYELFFEAEGRGLTVQEFLDEYYGPKVRGKNPLRQEAGRKNGPFDHTPESFHRHYAENPNINILMQEVKNLEEAERL